MDIGDTNTTYSGISSGIFHFSSGELSLQLHAILGEPSTCSTSSIVPIHIGPMTKGPPFFLSFDLPIILLGRVLL